MSILRLIACIVICELAGALGALTTATGSSPWYRTLNKPSFTPPSWVFGPVWTVLYAMMGVSLFLLWRARPDAQRNWAIAVFVVQLALNAAWTPVFFGLRAPTAAFVVIILLWLAIAACVAVSWRVSPAAAALLLPYLAWVSYATVLNSAIARLN